MKLFAVIVGVLGLASVLSAAIYSTPAILNGEIQLSPIFQVVARIGHAVGGILFLLMAKGIWCRQHFAWQLGFVYIGATAFFTVALLGCVMFENEVNYFNVIIVAIFSLFAIGVYKFWTFVWSKQKFRFETPTKKGVNKRLDDNPKGVST